MKCKICAHNMNELEKAHILSKYYVQYYHCEKCGFVCTEYPYWLGEAYDRAITRSDIGLLKRNIWCTKEVINIVSLLFPDASHFLDYGGGFGVFVRMMRDNGYDFEWYDKYCDNLFAEGHEQSKNWYDIVTAFELFEHLLAPGEEIENILRYSNTIIFSTETIGVNPPKLKEWWYYSLETGQHISFYTKKSLWMLAKKNGLYYYSIGNNLHIFSKKTISKFLLFLLNRRWINTAFFYINRRKRKSLTEKDYCNLVQNQLTSKKEMKL